MKKILGPLLSALLMAGSMEAECFDNGCYDYGCGEPVRSLINPCGFYIGFTGMWAKPMETGLGTFTDSWQYLNSDGSVTSLSKPTKPDYKFAGGFQVGYDFGCSANNIEVEYFRLHNQKRAVNDTSDNPISFGSIFFNVSFPLTPGVPFVSDSTLKFDLHQVDATFGHRFQANCLQLHPFIGVRFAHLKRELPFEFGFVNAHYWGAGPFAGIDGFYSFCGGFGIVGRLDGAVLVGETKANSRLAFGPFNSRFVSPKQNRIVGTLGGRLGLAYKFCFCNRSSLKLEVGYQANLYIGPLDTITGWEPNAITLQRIASLTTNNFGYSGPYFNLTWHM